MRRQAQHERALLCHPDTPAGQVRGVSVGVRVEHGVWTVEFTVDGAAALAIAPPLAVPERTDGLWQHLCFELFVRPDRGSGYYEFNFAQTNRWAAYAFDGYRDGMRDLDLRTPPEIRGVLGARVDLDELSIASASVGLSAVIEEGDGTKSYWALAHPPGAPDFHHPDCFALHIPALAST